MVADSLCLFSFHPSSESAARPAEAKESSKKKEEEEKKAVHPKEERKKARRRREESAKEGAKEARKKARKFSKMSAPIGGAKRPKRGIRGQKAQRVERFANKFKFRRYDGSLLTVADSVAVALTFGCASVFPHEIRIPEPIVL
jgi:alanyl-tRNA synthetase